MATDNLTISDTNYVNIAGIKVRGTGNGMLTYVRPTGTKSITENGTGIDVTQYANVDVDVSTGPDWPTFTTNDEGTNITCDKTYAECRALIQDGVTGAFAQFGSFSAVLIALWVNAANEDLHYIYVDNGVPVSQLNYASDGTITTQDSADSVTTLDIIQNGTYSDGLWNKVEVNVPAPAPKLQSKTAIPTEQQQIVVPDSDYHYDGLSRVTVNAIPSTYVGSGVTRRSSSDITNKDNFLFTVPAGYYSEDASCWPSDAVFTWDEPSVDSYGNITVQARTTTPGYLSSGVKFNSFTLPDYVGSNITRRSSSDLTASGATVTVPSGYYSAQASKAVASGTAGTPTATKGTVSNHSVSVTPSVTNTTGYITGDTKTGTAVTVSASELVSGTKSITENGTAIDVTQYSNVDVNVPGMSETDLKNLIEGSNSFVDIDWPDGLSYIHPGAFMSCDYFNPSSLPSGVTRIGERAFAGCSNLAITSLPNSITTIEPYAFLNCFQLALTSLPNSLITIGDQAFNNCRSLALTELPSGVTTMGPSCFNGCSMLALTSLPSGITTIAGSTFLGCSKLALTSLPSGVTTIGSNCFKGCSKLALTSLPSGLTSIGSYAFQNCGKLALTSLPSGITTIPFSAFADCTSLALTSLPSGVTNIAADAFRSCTSLTSISCDGVITTLDGGVFNGDTNRQMQLTSASFPNMTTISLGTAFGSTTAANACQQLKFCDIGSTTGISKSAFANCYALKTLVLRKTASVCSLGDVNAFLNTPMRGYNNLTGKVYVPSALISKYQTAFNWKTLYNAGTVTFVAIEGSVYER